MQHFIRWAGALTLLLGAGALAANAQTTTVPAAPATSPTPIATPENPPENTLITARVTQEFVAWQRGKIDRKTYSPPAGGTYDNAVIGVISPDLAAIGAPQTTTYRTASLLFGDLVYRYDVTGTNGTVSVLYSLSQDGKIDGINFTPQIFRAPQSPVQPQASPAPAGSPSPSPSASPMR